MAVALLQLQRAAVRFTPQRQHLRRMTLLELVASALISACAGRQRAWAGRVPRWTCRAALTADQEALAGRHELWGQPCGVVRGVRPLQLLAGGQRRAGRCRQAHALRMPRIGLPSSCAAMGPGAPARLQRHAQAWATAWGYQQPAPHQSSWSLAGCPQSIKLQTLRQAVRPGTAARWRMG